MPPKLYTEAQAEAGKAIFMHTCTTCHGTHLEGKSAPPNAGTVFLNKAHLLDWTVGNLRTLVVSSMPLSNPGSLTPQQYAEVLAFLLASDCYPAGRQPFPRNDTAQLEHIPLTFVPGARPDNPALGTCNVR